MSTALKMNEPSVKMLSSLSVLRLLERQ